MPITKIGMVDGSPPPDFSAISSGVNTASIWSNKAIAVCFVVGDRRALGGVAGEQVRERTAVILEVRKALPSAKSSCMRSVFDKPSVFAASASMAARCGSPAREFFRIGQIDVDAGDIRIEPERFEIGLLRLVQLAEFFQHVAHVVVGVGEVGLERERAPVMLERRVQIAALEVDAAHHVGDIVIVRVERQRTFGGRRGLLDLVLIEKNAGVVHVELVDARLDDQRAAHQVGGLVEPFQILQREREIVERRRDCWDQTPAPCDRRSRPPRGALARADRCRDCSRRRRSSAAVRWRGDRPARLRQSA